MCWRMLSGIPSAMLSRKADQTEADFKGVLQGAKLAETRLRQSKLLYTVKHCLSVYFLHFIQASNELKLSVKADGDLWEVGGGGALWLL